MKLMRLTNKEFLKAFKVVQDQKVPVRTAYKLIDIARKIQEENDKYDKIRQTLLTKYGTKREDGSLDTNEKGNVNFTQENLRKFMGELNELLEVEVEVGTLKLDDLGDIQLTTQELLELEELLAK